MSKRGQPTKYTDELGRVIADDIINSKLNWFMIAQKHCISRTSSIVYAKRYLGNQYEDIMRDREYSKKTLGVNSVSFDDYRVVNARNSNIKRHGDCGSVYLLHLEGFNIYKIGVTNNLHRRLRDIKSANAFNVKLIYTTRAMGAYALEEKIITRYSNKIMKGEWMTLDELEVSEIIMTIKQWQADQQSIMTK